MNERLLKIYMNDHLAGATVGRELCRRALRSNTGSNYEPLLQNLLREIEEDLEFLEDVMDKLSISKDPIKTTGAWVAEKVGRLKLNGQLTGYSPLSRLEELEGLALDLEGKLALWQALKGISDFDSRLAVVDFDSYVKRAEAQRDELEKNRLQAAAEALG